ncbi:MAG: ATP-binding protein [Sphaerochaetaceae bacterium]|jgi:hypothetical protein|nr:ATP-binding protein [Sphaerochaetaceae bacterium]HHU87983.1 sensor histidine kinase [Spirochaetales bacterium]
MHLSLCDFLSDVVQNGIEAGAGLIEVVIEQTTETIEFSVSDNGKGMSDKLLQRVLDPFYTDGVKHANRKVGLGLPFLVQATEAAEGSFSIESQEGEGTQVKFGFNLNHIDCPPIGDIALTILSLLIYEGDYEAVVRRILHHKGGVEEYTVERSQLEEILGDFASGDNLYLLREYLRSQEAALDDYKEGSGNPN